MNTKQTIFIYTILGTISFLIAYLIYAAAKISMNVPENTTQGVFAIVFAATALMGLLFFVPVATGLYLLSKKK